MACACVYADALCLDVVVYASALRVFYPIVMWWRVRSGVGDRVRVRTGLLFVRCSPLARKDGRRQSLQLIRLIREGSQSLRSRGRARVPQAVHGRVALPGREGEGFGQARWRHARAPFVRV